MVECGSAANTTPMSQIHLLRVASVDRTTRDAVVVRFHQPPFGRIHYLPGQYVTLRIELGGEVFFRSYSICSAPKLDNTLDVAVKRVDGGLVSNWLADHVDEGMELEVLEPRGRFFIDNSVKEKRRILLIGGGSGLTPLFSILRSTLFGEPLSEVVLVASNREEEDLLFRRELAQLGQIFPGRFTFLPWWSGKQGRLQPGGLLGLLAALPDGPGPVTAFLCGPPHFMEMCRSALLQSGLADSSIHEETFLPGQGEVQRRQLSGNKTRVVRVEWQGVVHTLRVPPGSTVLDAAMDRGLALPHSCKRGTCASCIATLAEGSAAMLQEDALLDFERAKGKILTCQAQPLSDDVLITFSISA